MWNDVPHQTQCELRVSIHNVIITNVDWSNLHEQMYMYTGKQIFKELSILMLALSKEIIILTSNSFLFRALGPWFNCST